MAAFNQLVWQDLDVWAIAGMGGLASIEEQDHEIWRSWLSQRAYSLDTLDCTRPLNEVVANLDKMLRWEEQFGYTPNPETRNLDALRDGFVFNIPEGGGHVLELVRADLIWQQDREWVCGLLKIGQEYSRWQLALGRRFFLLLVLPPESAMIGDIFAKSYVPHPFSPYPRGLRARAEGA